VNNKQLTTKLYRRAQKNTENTGKTTLKGLIYSGNK